MRRMETSPRQHPQQAGQLRCKVLAKLKIAKYRKAQSEDNKAKAVLCRRYIDCARLPLRIAGPVYNRGTTVKYAIRASVGFLT